MLLPLAPAIGCRSSAAAQAPEAEDTSMQEIHRKLSAQCFNECWTYIDMPDRSAADVETMVLLAYASLYHWKQREDVAPINLSVGYWQVSRVHALAGQYDMAKQFGQRCLEVGKESRLAPFYVGYAYEALARAELASHHIAPARELLAQARSQLDRVTDKDEQELLGGDLAGLEKALSGQ
jgi:hypothetical protein